MKRLLAGDVEFSSRARESRDAASSSSPYTNSIIVIDEVVVKGSTETAQKYAISGISH